MIIISDLKDLPKMRFVEVDGEIPSGILADFYYVSKTLQLRKYFFTIENAYAAGIRKERSNETV